jgi:lycopene cyclase domain-containing protein
MKSEYLLFNLFIFFSSTLGASLYRNTHWPRLKPAACSIAVFAGIFLFWDVLVTNFWWSFNQKYILGLMLGSLPIEEVLFFFSVPWSCLILWVNIKKRVVGKVSFPLEQFCLSTAMVVGGASLLAQWWYTLAVSVAGVLLLLFSLWNKQWLRQRSVLAFSAMCVGLTLIFNGYLTARPVVLYNSEVKSNINLYTIPLEDVIYGLILVLATSMLYDFFESKRS